jgi:hypothetical protein
MTSLTTRDDLTRWNRAGLPRFRYTDGNAAVFLEVLRLAMAEQFTSGGINQWAALDAEIPVPPDETAADKDARWRAQYQAQRRDYAWEILRTCARSAHLLAEYLDAYANEGFLRTATQWENVRRLVEMIDYHPAPPAAAETPLALLAKAEKSGRVAAGFACKNQPADGSKPAVFETLADLEVDAQLNLFRGADWNLSQVPLNINPATQTLHFPLAQPLEDVAVGSVGVLVVEGGWGMAVTVVHLDAAGMQLQGEPTLDGLPDTILRHQAQLWLKPAAKRRPALSGSNVMTLSDAHGLSLGAAVAWQLGATWMAAAVTRVAGNTVALSHPVPVAGTDVYLLDYSVRATYDINGTSQERIVMPAHRESLRHYGAVWDENLYPVADSHDHAMQGATDLYDFFPAPAHDQLYYLPLRDPVASVLSADPQALTFEGKAKNLATGDWVVALNSGSRPVAAAVLAVAENPDNFQLTLSRGFAAIDSVCSQFALVVRPADHDRNQTPVFMTEPARRSAFHSTLPLAFDTLPALLDAGRTLIIQGKNTALRVVVQAVDRVGNTITVAPALPGSEPGGAELTEDFTRCDTVIYGNVVQAGHGETQNKKVLGSGDATRSGQTFHLDVREVSFVPDAAFANGVKAALDIQVDGRTYQQMTNLRDSAPADPHYRVRMREDGTLDITFGDGMQGRRLPSGNNNIQVLLRKGVGLSGNLPPLSITKEVKPHYLLSGVCQPLLAVGGNDMESPASMRELAPRSLLTLARAVAVTDFANLAQAYSGVWQAAAIQQPSGTGRAQRIQVAVVPAGGGDLGVLTQTLQNFLQASALPGIHISLVRYQSIILNLQLQLQVATAEFDPLQVSAAVRAHLLESFSLRNARLGKAFYTSQILAAVETVAGVENGLCTVANHFVDESGSPVAPQVVAMSAGGAVKRISPGWQQLVWLSPVLSDISITTQAFNL